MYRQINTFFGQGPLNLGHKNAITTNLCQRHVRVLIADSTNLLDLEVKTGPLLT
jgi:hypothetical protein